MVKYNPKKIEDKWQNKWYESGVFKAKNGSKKRKFYLLVEFPYPSGDGLHVGHCRSFTAFDIIARKRRMQGYNVLYPMGWDAFGLPTENYAIKKGVHPSIVTKKNTDNFRSQMKNLGCLLIGQEKLTPQIQSIINGRNGFLFNYLKMDWPIKIK